LPFTELEVSLLCPQEPPLVPILSQMSPVNTLTHYLISI